MNDAYLRIVAAVGLIGLAAVIWLLRCILFELYGQRRQRERHYHTTKTESGPIK